MNMKQMIAAVRPAGLSSDMPGLTERGVWTMCHRNRLLAPLALLFFFVPVVAYGGAPVPKPDVYKFGAVLILSG